MRLIINLIFLFSLLVVSGCAHQRLMDAGNDYLAQGQYQSAIEKYEAALKREPNDQDTRAKLTQAKAGFQAWLEQVYQAAKTAENQKHYAKAELLYAKLLKHNFQTSEGDKVYQLRQKSMADHGLSLYLDISQPNLKQNLNHRFSQVNFLKNKPQTSKNAKLIRFELKPMLVDLHKQQVERSEQYVSHQENIVNPDYEALQHQVSEARIDIKDLNLELDEQKQRASIEQRDLSLMEKDLEIGLLKLERLEQSSPQYQPLMQNISQLRVSIANQRKVLNRSETKIERSERKIRKLNEGLDELFFAMDDTPQLALVDILADYVYPVSITTQIANAELNVTSPSGSRRYVVTTEYQDESHDAHELIGLENNPLVLKKRTELEDKLHTQARLKISDIVESEITTHQQFLLSESTKQRDQASQLNLKLVAMVASQQPLPRSESRLVEQMLKREFGIAGQFNLKELLLR